MGPWTIPNVITVGRIGLILCFGVLLVMGNDVLAIAALAIAGVSDWLDGFLARRWNQQTELGRILDPAADRILTVVVVLGLAVRDIVPWWLVAVLLARDVVVGIALLLGRKRGRPTPHVTFMGKLATALLYVFLPLAYLAVVAFADWAWLHTLAIVGATCSAILYWWSGLSYVAAASRPAKSGTSPTDEHEAAAYYGTPEEAP
jgi:cardiolipin synthase